MSFGDAEYAGKKKKTRRDMFLEEMEQVVPWASLVESATVLSERRARPAADPLERMLRMHFLQHWYGLADRAMEEALYEITPCAALPAVADDGDSGRDDDPELPASAGAARAGPAILFAGERDPDAQGLMRKGDASWTPRSSPRRPRRRTSRARDPEMHQTKKGNQWHFGMKAHIGVDADSGLVHTVATTAANEADVEVVHELLHGKEQVVHADSGYTGADKRVQRKKLEWQIAAKRGKIKAMADGREKRKLEKIEKRKASVRAKVEHPFRVIKRQFGLMKVRFRGLAKNTSHVITLFALSNLWMARRRLLAMTG